MEILAGMSLGIFSCFPQKFPQKLRHKSMKEAGIPTEMFTKLEFIVNSEIASGFLPKIPLPPEHFQRESPEIIKKKKSQDVILGLLNK